MSDPWGSLTWLVTRTSGFVAYGLVTASVLLGIALSLKWRSTATPRFVTNELHRFVTLLSLAFLGVHAIALVLDPFMKFSVGEILVPLASHYRPLWVALGVVAAYLLAALWLSERVRDRIGYAWWRRFHALAFVAFVLATVHGIATGSDTKEPWALAIYAGSLFAVAALSVLRLFPRDARRPAHPILAAVGLVVLFELALFTALGPLRPGWNAIANEGRGSGQVVDR
jgi:predicted ferric reductase